MNEVVSRNAERLCANLTGEIASVRSLLDEYERAISPHMQALPHGRKEIQNLDLAIQVLADLETVARAIHGYVLSGGQEEIIFSRKQLVLERSKNLFRNSPESQIFKNTDSPVELFNSAASTD